MKALRGRSRTTVRTEVALGLLVGLGGVLFALGSWLRLHALGARPLAVDEYYFLTSVLSILEDGIPELPGGGLYIRGLLLQYLTAGCIWLQGNPIAGLRLVPALAGLGTSVLVGVYARRHLPLLPSLVLGLIFLFSSWQVEFSLFGRMYAGLQLFTLAYLLYLDEAVKAGTRSKLVLLSLVGLIGLGIHEVAILFIPPLFLLALVPLDYESKRFGMRWSWVLAPAIVLVCALLVRIVDFRNLGVGTRLPEGYTYPREGSLLLPTVWGVGESIYSLLALALLFVAFSVVYSLLAIRKGRPGFSAWIEATWVGVFLASAALHQFVLMGLMGVLLYRRYRDPGAGFRRQLRFAFWGGVSISLGWVALVGTQLLMGGLTAWGMPPDAGSIPGLMRRLFFSWPDIYRPLAEPWFEAFPLLATMFFLAVAWRVARVLGRPLQALLRDPAMVLLYFALAVGIAQTLYTSVRYTYFLYPVAWVVLGQAIMDWVGWLVKWWPGEKGREVRDAGVGNGVPALWNLRVGAATVALTLVFLLSRDFHPSHLLGLTGPEASYRIGRWAGYHRIWYSRWDVLGPSDFVQERAGEADAVVVINIPAASYYLGRPHVIFVPRDRLWSRYVVLAQEEGTVDVWSGQPLVGTLQDLGERIGEIDRVWFMDHAPASPELVEFLGQEQWRWETVFSSVDQRIQVIRADRMHSIRPAAAAVVGSHPLSSAVADEHRLGPRSTQERLTH